MISIDSNLALTIGAIALAGFAQSVTGFGFGLLSMPLLSLLIGVQEAYAILVIPNLAVCAVSFAANYRQYQWRHGLGLLLGACVTAPVGYCTMLYAGCDRLMSGLGILICLFSASELLMPRTRPLKLAESSGWIMGLLSGYLSGACNMGGPPAVAYVYSQSWPKEHIVALLQLVLGTTSVIRLVMMQGTGLITGPVLWMSLLVIGPLLLSIYAGSRLLRNMTRERLRRPVFVFLFAIGAKCALRF